MKLACLRFWCSLAPLSYPVKSTDPGSHSMIRFRVWIDGQTRPELHQRQSGTINGYLGVELTVY